MDYRIGNVAGFAAIIIWSLVPLLVSFCAGVALLPFLSIVCFVTFAAFLIAWIIGHENPLTNLRTSPKALLVSILGNGISRAMYWSALLLIDPAQAALISQNWAMLAVIFAALLAGSKLGIKHGLGILAGLAAITVLVSGPTGPISELTSIHLMTLISAIMWAGYTALARHNPCYAGNAVATGFLTCGIGFAILAFVTGASWHFPPHTLLLILLAGTAGSAGSYIWDIGRRHGHEQTLGKSALLLPLLSAFWLIAFGRSEPTPQIIIGALLVFAAVTIVSPYLKRKNIVSLDDER